MNILTRKSLLLAVLFILFSIPIFSSGKKKDNLVLIVVNKWRGDALGHLQRESVKTPNLDELVQQGISFTQAVSSCPLYPFSIAMLMGGVYPNKMIVSEKFSFKNKKFKIEFYDKNSCLLNILREAGYNTKYIDERILEKQSKIQFDKKENYSQIKKWYPRYQIDKTIEFINEKKGDDNPFSIILSINLPDKMDETVPVKYRLHYLNLNSQKIIDNSPDLKFTSKEMQSFFKKNIKNYYSYLTGIDDQIGRLIQNLRELNLFENTLIVFTSANGYPFGRHNLKDSDNFYDSSMRIPLIISYPKKIVTRIDNRTLISLADLNPTILSLLDLEEKIPASVQAIDLSDIILGNSETPQPAYQPYYKLNGEMLCEFNNKKELSVFRGLRDLRWTYIAEIIEGKIIDEILYDRFSDPYQIDNIAFKNSSLVKKFRDDLILFLNKTGDTVLSRSYLK